MRVLMINHYASPPTMAGGTRHYNFARQLIQRGHEVSLVAANYNHFSQSFTDATAVYGKPDHRDDVPFFWIPTPAYQGNTIARFNNMLSFSWRTLQQKYLPCTPSPDIIIGSSPHLFAALSGALLAKRLKIPFILEVRDLWPESLIDLGRISTHHPVIKLMRMIERHLYKRADRIISLLPSANQYLTKHGVKPENIVWLPNMVDIEAIPNNIPRINSTMFTVMYAGAHGLANDLDTVLHAAKLLEERPQTNHIQICLVGEGPEKSRLKTLAMQMNLTRVIFYDSVPKSEIYSMLNQADVFLMLLKNSPVFRWGISPNKLFDYFAMKRPVIFGVETPYNPVEKYRAGISIKPSDPHELAEAIVRLSLLPKNELDDMGDRGKQFVMQHHHIKPLTDSLEKVMLEAIHH